MTERFKHSKKVGISPTSSSKSSRHKKVSMTDNKKKEDEKAPETEILFQKKKRCGKSKS